MREVSLKLPQSLLSVSLRYTPEASNLYVIKQLSVFARIQGWREISPCGMLATLDFSVLPPLSPKLQPKLQNLAKNLFRPDSKTDFSLGFQGKPKL